MLKVVLLVLLAEVWSTTGHIIFKKITNQLEAPDLRNFSSSMALIRDFLVHPSMWFGLLSLTVGLLFWLLALSQGELSFVFPLGSAQFLFTLAASVLFLKEKVDWRKMIGTLLVAAGIALVGIS